MSCGYDIAAKSRDDLVENRFLYRVKVRTLVCIPKVKVFKRQVITKLALVLDLLVP